jgi:carboxyl-terminal processing protease
MRDYMKLPGVALVLVLLHGSVSAAESPPLGVVHDEAFREVELLAATLLQVRKNYVEERSYDELIKGAIRGMLGELDPHSAFLDTEDYENLVDETSGSYAGVGLQIGVRDNELVVIAPIEDTPAFRAGVQPGDRIVAINGARTTGVALRDAVRQLRGRPGESVRITVIGREQREEQELVIIRDRIEVNSVKGAQILRKGIGYVRVTQFDEPVSGKLRDVLQGLRDDGMRALILDLRSNPGGLLQQAIRVSSLFLVEGQEIVSTRGRGGMEDHVARVSRTGLFEDLPLVVLVNKGSASAAEIVAGAIQGHHRGILIGEQTYGKASIQSVIRMPSKDRETAIRLTTGYYYTPLDRQIHDQGITPDIVVPLGRDEWQRVQVRRQHLDSPDGFTAEELALFEDAVDRQLERGADLLEALLIYGRQPEA